MVLYAAARLVLFVLLLVVVQGAALIIESPVPFPVSMLLALLIAFPLSMLVFNRLRSRVLGELAEWNTQRSRHKQWVRDELAAR